MAPCILVIDDDPDLRRLIELALARNGYEVHGAENGHFGLQLFEAVKPDLVITDILMPVMEGMATIMALRGSPRRPRIIAISGGGVRVNRDVLKWAFHLGADEVLAKPFLMSALVGRVRGLLSENLCPTPNDFPAQLAEPPKRSTAT